MLHLDHGFRSKINNTFVDNAEYFDIAMYKC